MLRKLLLAFVLLAASAGSALAVPITVDEVLYDSTSVTDASLLAGTIDMGLSGNTLTITLTNISGDLAGSGAGILLTGIGFSLPTGVAISSGSAYIAAGSTAVGFVAPAGGNISNEWGYDNDPLNSGAFLNNGVFTYNTVASSMESMTSNQFAAGSTGPPVNLGGPDFGAVSALETGSLGAGNEAVRSSILIQLVLSGTVPGDLLSQIESGHVGLSFGSPNVSNVPEPSSLSLLALGAIFAGSRIRSRRKQA